MYAVIKGIDYYLPPTLNPQGGSLSGRSAENLREKTGVESRRVAAEQECASDLGVLAAQRLFEGQGFDPGEIDFLLFCTQTPDYLIPSSACLMQARLGVPSAAGALDYNLGCSGYLYGLSLAKGLIESAQARNILLITGDTQSKLTDPGCGDAVQSYGDGAAATLIAASSDPELAPGIGPFVFGTDGTAAEHMIVRNSGFRGRAVGLSAAAAPVQIHVDGLGLFESGMRVVPELVRQVLEKAGLSLDDIETAVFYQAGKTALELLRRRAGIPAGKVFVSMKDCGNVSSSNIPIALKRASDQGVLKKHDRVLLAGFGSGLSWAGAVLRWAAEPCHPKNQISRQMLQLTTKDEGALCPELTSN
jgi:3-oxoacyl-[acyl-carrier-protein] synthase-3